ncbi:MAG: hypothetical protein ACRC42_01605 [Mycoplasma sp.]
MSCNNSEENKESVAISTTTNIATGYAVNSIGTSLMSALGKAKVAMVAHPYVAAVAAVAIIATSTAVTLANIASTTKKNTRHHDRRNA